MDFDADGGSIQNGISAYFTLPPSNGGNDQFKNFVYKYGPGVGYGTPSNSKYLLQWKYRIDGDDVWMDTMNNTDHVIYLTLSTPTGSESVSSDEVLNFACGWAENKTTDDSVCVDILNNGFKEHYEYYDDGPCAYFSSDFCRLVESLGITCILHRWARAQYPRREDTFEYSVNDMMGQKTISIKTVHPLNSSSEVYTWQFHQWCEAGGKTRDPSTGDTHTRTGTTNSSNWGAYEDYVFFQYEKCLVAGATTGRWVDNKPRQEIDCEAPAHRVYGMPPPERWLGPDVNPF